MSSGALCDLVMVHSADGVRVVLDPVIARDRDTVKRFYFRGDAGFANPRSTSSSKPRAWVTQPGCRPKRVVEQGRALA
jgi:hypothetical protein